jgi:hypothetical protein
VPNAAGIDAERGSMNTTLLERARLALSEERLPRAPGTRVWASHGDASRTCAVCGASIAPGHLEMQLEWDRGRRIDVAALHLSCYAAWRTAVDGVSATAWRERPARH